MRDVTLVKLNSLRLKCHIRPLIFFFFYSGRVRVNRAGRKPVRAGRSALRNRTSWNTEVWAQFCGRSMKKWAQICKHKHFYIGCLKTQQQLHFVNYYFFFL